MDTDFNMEAAYLKMQSLLPQKELEQFISTPAEELTQYNYGLGTMIRLKMLGSRSLLRRELERQGVTDTDSMALLLIEGFHAWLLPEQEDAPPEA